MIGGSKQRLSHTDPIGTEFSVNGTIHSINSINDNILEIMAWYLFTNKVFTLSTVVNV